MINSCIESILSPRPRKTVALALLALASLTGCKTTGDDAVDLGPGMCGEGMLAPMDEVPTFAVVGSGEGSASLGFVDAEGEVLVDSWINSGTQGAGLVTALGTDIVLPTTQGAGTFSFIDRYQTDVVSTFCFDGSLMGQVRLNPPPDGTGFSSNPYDYVVVDSSTAFASRFEQNADPTAPALEQGGDLIGIDPSTMTLNGDRIDLTMFNTVVTGFDTTQMQAADVTVWTRPERIVQVDNTLLVGMSRLPADLWGGIRGTGEGAVAIVDLETRDVSSFLLNGLANCGHIQPIHGTDNEILISCKGYSNLGFSDEAGTRATAGFVRARFENGKLNTLSSWRAASDAMGTPMPVWGATSLGGNRVVGVQFGTFGDEVNAGTGDQFIELDLATGEQTVLYTASTQYVIGTSAVKNGLLLVPDSAAGVVLRFNVGDTTEADGNLEIGPEGIAPKAVYAL